MPLSESELILNSDGSVYHLNLRPEDIGNTIFTVGDPERVNDISKHFDRIEVKKAKREFHTHTGYLGKKRLTVISTGIGTDNIDIVLNELDALVNIDFTNKKEKEVNTALTLVRVGTSGTIQKDIPLDSLLVTEMAIGLDGLLHFYSKQGDGHDAFETELCRHLDWSEKNIFPYVMESDAGLLDTFSSKHTISGITVTNAGFYAPQGRQLRLQTALPDFFEKLTSFRFAEKRITNLEMETAGIYGLSKLLGHRAISLNAILANRATGHFSKNASKTVEKLIEYTLSRL